MPVLPHGESEAQDRILRNLRFAILTSAVLLGLEAVGALYSRSLALTVDAVHNVPDLLAFAVSFLALQGATHGSSEEFTFGHHRREVIAGVANGALVLGTGVAFGYEAGSALLLRTSFAGPVDALWVLAVALPVLALRALSLTRFGTLPGRVRDLNLRSVIVHLGSDLAITGALLGVGGILLRPGLGVVDPLAALFIAVVLVYQAIPLLREGWVVLGEGAPLGLSPPAISASARQVPGVVEIHDLHVWSVCSSLVCLPAHVGVREMSVRDAQSVVAELRRRMEREFGIVHATFEVECVGARPPRPTPTERAGAA
jgi:cobalt-zinc-cadmium efflux system protein